MSEQFSVGLPKWPALVVRGERVTPIQATEILVRTDPWYVSCNDREWERTIREIVGLKEMSYNYNDGSTFEDRMSIHRENDKKLEELGRLNLHYLGNHRIASAYIGGPHGWCDWNGRIGCDSYNIGKWPSVEEVAEDWREIASTFPYLNLLAQLFDGEGCEEGTNPVVEFEVSKGVVVVRAPTDKMMAPYRDLEGDVANIFTPGRERGCTAAKLKEAVSYVRELMGSK